MVKLLTTVLAVVPAALIAASAHGHVAPKKSAPRPQHGRTVRVTATRGHVIVFRRGNRKVTLQPGHPVLVPLGTVIDAGGGTAVITAAADSRGSRFDHGGFSSGAFAVGQTGSSTSISLGGNGPRTCSRPRRLVSRMTAHDHFFVMSGTRATRPAPAPSRLAGATATWIAKDQCTSDAVDRRKGKIDIVVLGSRRAPARVAAERFRRGQFVTRGRYSSATVRGRVRAP